MNIEFHYYIVHFLCKHAGFSPQEAQVVSYSSQFIDHNIITYAIDTGRETYRTIPTQNYGFWDQAFPKEVYIPFHFFPGDPDHPACARADGKVNPLNCTPNSPLLKELLISGLRSKDLYRIGIALHTYADSWAHQNFSGALEDWNALEQRSLVPSIGHAHALKKPDVLDLMWKDPRLPGDRRTVSNRARFFRAARQIYKYLRTYNRLGFGDLDLVMWELERIVGSTEGRKAMEERVADFVI